MNKETKVGIFVVVILFILYFGFNYLKGTNFLSPANKYYAMYNNIDQLAISNPVLINGYIVGRVSQISILQQLNNRILVELNIDSDVILGDSTIATLNADFLGKKSILLNVGDISKPLNRGDTLYTEVAQGMLDMFTEQAEPVANNIQITLRKLDAVLDMLALNSTRLDTIFTRFMYTPVLINKMLINGNQKIENISSSLLHTSENISTTLQGLRPAIKNLERFSKSLTRLELTKTLTEIQEMLRPLTKVLNRMTMQNNTLGKLTAEDSLYVNINTLLLRLDTLTTHFNDNPKHFLGPLGKNKRHIERNKRKEKKKK